MAYTYDSAQDVVNEQTTDNSVDADAAARAAAAGVDHVAYVNYAQAMTNYQNRTDVETLADRRLRENAATFAEQNKFRGTGQAGTGY